MSSLYFLSIFLLFILLLSHNSFSNISCQHTLCPLQSYHMFLRLPFHFTYSARRLAEWHSDVYFNLLDVTKHYFIVTILSLYYTIWVSSRSPLLSKHPSLISFSDLNFTSTHFSDLLLSTYIIPCYTSNLLFSLNFSSSAFPSIFIWFFPSLLWTEYALKIWPPISETPCAIYYRYYKLNYN